MKKSYYIFYLQYSQYWYKREKRKFNNRFCIKLSILEIAQTPTWWNCVNRKSVQKSSSFDTANQNNQLRNSIEARWIRINRWIIPAGCDWFTARPSDPSIWTRYVGICEKHRDFLARTRAEASVLSMIYREWISLHLK